MATVRNQVLLLSLPTLKTSAFQAGPQQEKSVNAMLDQVIAWGGALKTLRRPQNRSSNGCGPSVESFRHSATDPS